MMMGLGHMETFLCVPCRVVTRAGRIKYPPQTPPEVITTHVEYRVWEIGKLTDRKELSEFAHSGLGPAVRYAVMMNPAIDELDAVVVALSLTPLERAEAQEVFARVASPRWRPPTVYQGFRTRAVGSATCSLCAEPMKNMGIRWRPPKKRNKKAWKAIDSGHYLWELPPPKSDGSKSRL